ncbi:hypothetical protein ACFYZT_24600 [Streptomyces sp. NPDC001591]|uniref:hypothetical protein n=1 Tax=Streptomyces sp. NPDC001591 TaxID=3364589 RepID=UPI00367921B8
MSEDRFTPSERAAIEQGYVALAVREIEQLAGDIQKAVLGEAAQPSAHPATARPKRRSRLQRAYDRAASFAGALMIIMISGSVGLFLGAALVMNR